MRVPRYWRMKEQEYQLTGNRAPDGSTSVIQRPARASVEMSKHDATQETVAAEAA